MVKKKSSVKKQKSNNKTNKTNNKNSKDIKKDKSLIYGLIIVIGIFALILLSLNSKNNDDDEVPEIEIVNYKGIIFEKHGTIWSAALTVEDKFHSTKKDFNILFHFNPYEVEHIPSMQNSRNESTTPIVIINRERVFITMDPEYPASVVLSGVELAKILAQVYGMPVKAAITRKNNRTNAPIITCEDFTAKTGIILLKLGNETRIYNDLGCIVVQGTDPTELLKAAEKLVFEMLRII